MRRSLTIGLTSLVLANVMLAAAGVQHANAETSGTLTFGPPAGQDITPMSAFTSGQCAGGTNLQMKVTGKGFAAEGVPVTGNTGQAIYPKTPDGGFEVPFPNTMRVIADDHHPPVVLDGTYTFVVTCRDRLTPKAYSSFTGSLTFTSPTTYTSTGAASAASPRASASPSTGAAGSDGAPDGAAPDGAAPRAGPPRTLPPHTSVTGQPNSQPASKTATEQSPSKSGSTLPPALLGSAAVFLLAGAVTVRRRKSGRKQAFIRP